MTLPRSQALKIPQLSNVNSNTSYSDYKIPTNNIDRLTSGNYEANEIVDEDNQHHCEYMCDNCPKHLVGNSSTECNQQSNSMNTINNIDKSSYDKRYNVVLNNSDDVKIPMVGRVARVKRNDRLKVFGLVKNIFNWKKDSRIVGYYIPPLEYRRNDIARNILPIDKDVIHEIDGKDQKDVISFDDCNISNYSLKNIDEIAFEDDLEMYMAEVRQREKM